MLEFKQSRKWMMAQAFKRQFRDAPLRQLLQRQILVMMMGVPGSGKSYFARQLANCLGMIRLNSDALRTEKYGHPEPIRGLVSSRRILQILDYRCQAALGAGFSVVRDHMHHNRRHRSLGKLMAEEVGALPIIVWIKTPHDLAKRRGLERQLGEDQFPKRSPQAAQESIDKWHAAIDLSSSDREEISYLEMDGCQPFEEQMKKFLGFLNKCN